MLVLGFDTAAAAVSVALHDGTGAVAEAFTADARRHGELLAPMIATVMADAGAARAELTAIAVGVGPGPYTGLRVGVVTARVLGDVLGIPVHGLCSLDVIAAGAASTDSREFLVATDARRKEVYWARYDPGAVRVAGPEVGPAAEIPGAAQLPVAGAGGLAYPEAFGEVTGPAYPDARTLCAIVAARLSGPPAAADLPPPPQAAGPTLPQAAGPTLPRAAGPTLPRAAGPMLLPPEPLYLRRPDAREPGAPKRVTPR